MSQESVVATGAAEVIVAVKSRGGEVGRQALALGLHWRDSVLAIDPEQLADFPSTQAEKARREASRSRGQPVTQLRKRENLKVTDLLSTEREGQPKVTERCHLMTLGHRK